MYDFHQFLENNDNFSSLLVLVLHYKMTNSFSFSINLQFLVWYFRIFFPFQLNILKHFSSVENSKATQGHTHCSYATGSSLIDIIYMYCRWRSSYQEERVGIPLTSLTLSYFCACPRHDLDFLRHILWSFLCSVGSV